MAQPWITLAREKTPDGVLELRRRGERDFLILLDNLVLMNSHARRSEEALGRLACRGFSAEPPSRVLIGGLGMGITLRAVLDELPGGAEVVVAELNPVVVDWCRGPLAPLTAAAVADPRVRVAIADVAELIASAARASFDAVVFDLYRGPHARSDARNDPFYGSRAIRRVFSALRPGGVFAVWGEDFDLGFDRRLRAAGFAVSHQRPGRGGLRHAVFLARKPGGKG